MNVETELGAGVGDNLAEPISAENFEHFSTIANAAADEARNRPNPSVRISWFIGFVDTMVPENFTRGDLDLFFGIFPNLEFLNRLQAGETLVASVSERIEHVVSSWVFNSPALRQLIRAFEEMSQASELPMRAAVPAMRAAGRTSRRARRTRLARPMIVVDYSFPYDLDNFRALEEYINVGNLIKYDPGFINSALWNLEKFLRHGRPEVQRYLGDGHFLNSDDRLTKAFYAIAAPSLEGKTQSAFVFREVKPLYFVVSRRVNLGETQSIYENFSELSRQLDDFGQMDLEHIRQVNRSSGLGNNLSFLHISVKALSALHNRQRFYILGFIKALILDARANYRDTNNTTWMKYYVCTDRRLEVTPTSIAEFCRLGDNIIREFFLFLDEFTGSRDDLVNVLVRNLGRAANIKVLVANTNTKVTNLVGRHQAVHSRREVNAWAIVFTRLNPLNRTLLSAMVRDFADLKNDLYGKVEPHDLSYLQTFINNFLSFQVEKLRPGFVHLIVDSMKRFNVLIVRRRFSLNEFLREIVNLLGQELMTRKPDLTGLDPGLIGTKALYFSNAYGSVLDDDVKLMSHRKQYLDCHYYYLINPVDPSKFCFLTYPPGALSIPIQNTQTAEPRRAEGDAYLELYLKSTRGRVSSVTKKVWRPELTIFDENEILPFLAFLGIWHHLSISEILSRANVSTQVRNVDMPNPTQAVVRNGNALEVLSAVCTINASHRDLNSEMITFSGQGCKSFLSSLVKNLISANNCRIRSDYQVVFPTNEVIGTVFDRIHVPFLFPANLPIPGLFWRRFSSYRQFSDLPIHVGKFERTVNQDRIDAKFDLFLKDVSDTGYTRGICTIECKDLERNIDFGRLKDIFGKAQSNRANLSLLICNKIVENSEPKNLLELKAECLAQKWEVLKVVQRPPTAPTVKVFSIERLHPEICLPDSRCDYTMTCVILELDVINA